MTAGTQEAQLAFKGATASLTGSCCCLVIDLGGRSTELALGKCSAIPPQAPVEALWAVCHAAGRRQHVPGSLSSHHPLLLLVQVLLAQPRSRLPPYRWVVWQSDERAAAALYPRLLTRGSSCCMQHR